MKKLFALAILLFTTRVLPAQSILKKLYADTLHIDPVLKEKMIFKIQTHQSDTNNLTTLRYTQVVAYRVNEAYHANPKTVKEYEGGQIADRAHNKLSPFVGSEGKELSADQIKSLLTLCSTSENFVWSSCLGKVPECGFVFINHGKITGCITVSCHFGQADTAPFMLQTKWGTLTKEGSQKLTELCKEVGVYYEVKD